MVRRKKFETTGRRAIFFWGVDFDDFGAMDVFFSNLKPSMFLFLCVQECFPAQETPPWKKQSRMEFGLRHLKTSFLVGSHDVVGGKRWSYAPSLMACGALGSRL